MMTQEKIQATLPYQPVEIGPLYESTKLIAALDYYKPTMSQLAFEEEPNAEVTFTFHNRGKQRLADYIDEDRLQQRFDQIRKDGFSEPQLAYYCSLRMEDGKNVFSGNYINYLRTHELPNVEVSHDQEIDDLKVETTGPWALSSLWETVVMTEIDEAYYEGYMVKNDINPLDVYEDGDRRLSEKIAVLKDRPEIKFSDFGTRRHFSLRWHKHIIDRLMAECPDNYVGTSNVGLSELHGTKPIGTYAHEMPMVYAALADARGEDIRASHNKFLEAWFKRYGYEYSNALTDTFTSKFFFEDFTAEQAKKWKGLRQDSGSAIAFGEKAIDFYNQNDVNPASKRIVFSNNLDIKEILDISDTFMGRGQVDVRIQSGYGWGTGLTNDMEIAPLNMVMKATRAKDLLTNQEAYTVKFSDDEGKKMGPIELQNKYLKIFVETN